MAESRMHNAAGTPASGTSGIATPEPVTGSDFQEIFPDNWSLSPVFPALASLPV
jgi:hypothetical protein